MKSATWRQLGLRAGLLAALLSASPTVWPAAVRAEETKTQPAAQSPPRDDDCPERDELDARINQLLRTARPVGAEPLKEMEEEAAALLDLAERIGRHLDARPDEPQRERLMLAKLNALYIGGMLRGEGLERIDAEIATLDSAALSGTIREVVDYWRFRDRLNRLRARQALGQADSDEAIALIRAFVDANPGSTHAVAMIEKVIDACYAGNDLPAAEAYLDLLVQHHPRHVATAALVGRHRLRSAIGTEFRPSLFTLDGAPIDWTKARGRPVFIVFWSPTHGPSTRMIEHLKTFRLREGTDRFSVVTIALHRNSSIVRDKLAALDAAPPADIASWTHGHEPAEWRSAVADEYGIRALPLVLLIDENGILRELFEPRGWQMRRDFEESMLKKALAPMGPQPAPSFDVQDAAHR